MRILDTLMEQDLASGSNSYMKNSTRITGCDMWLEIVEQFKSKIILLYRWNEGLYQQND